MEHKISHASKTHLVKIPVPDILEVAGTGYMSPSAYTTLVGKGPDTDDWYLQISWVEEVDSETGAAS
jgi:hypothetical protein